MYLLIPFLVPYVVTRIGSRIRRRQKPVPKVSSGNPDIRSIRRINFTNTAAKLILKRMGMDEADADILLPKDTRTIVEEILGTDRKVFREKKVRGIALEFWFRAFPTEQAVFLSGRELTGRQEIEGQMENSYTNLKLVSDFADRTFKKFDPLTFDVQRHFQAITGQLLREKDGHEFDKPTHIFLAFRSENRHLKGHIYTKQNGRVVRDAEEIHVDPSKDKVAITLGQTNVVWSNWEEEEGSLKNYQNRFHKAVREKVGTIERFVTYTSQDIALIGFYRGKRVNELDASALKGLTVYAQSLKFISDQVAETEDAFIYTIEALARAAEANDANTGDHIGRVNEYSKLLAEELGIDAEFVRKIHYSAQMHDVGKIYLDNGILRKSGRLAPEEWAEMTQHTVFGAKILGDEHRLEMARKIALAHHEKFDGSGYPSGLKGEAIPLAARIVSVADVYDALRQERSYKRSLSHEAAFEIITQGDGRVEPEYFDPKVLEAFRKVADRMKEVFEGGEIGK